ncbi:MAG: hypothetical protein V1874_03985 [Spirochaetota bacterium]
MILSLKLILLAAFLLLQLIPTIVYSNTNQSAETTVKEYSAGSMLGFVKHLISQNEYYRAYSELKRLNSYYPGYINNNTYFTTELFLLYNGRRYSDILLMNFRTDLRMNAIHSVFISDAFIHNNEFIKAVNLANSITNSAGDDFNLYLYKRTLLSYIMLKKLDEAKSIVYNKKINIGLNDANKNIFELIDYSDEIYANLKNPCNAIALGAIPGMGYVYADRTATGVIAFFLISVLSALTYYSFKTDNKAIGVFVGTAATFFYGGSIIGGYLSAKSYNDSAVNDLKDSLTQKLNLSDDRKKLYEQYGVGSVGE